MDLSRSFGREEAIERLAETLQIERGRTGERPLGPRRQLGSDQLLLLPVPVEVEQP